MNPFSWNDSHSVGHPEIDAEHRALFRIAEELYDDIEDGTALYKLGGLMARLDSYSRFHFESEEALMRRTAFPEYHAHRREHEAFAAQLDELRNRSADLASSLMELLRKWIQEHTCGTDRRLMEHGERQNS